MGLAGEHEHNRLGVHLHTQSHTDESSLTHISFNGLMKLNALRQNCFVKLLYEYI